MKTIRNTTNKITGDDIQMMVRHWLNTPLNSYLGSDYGQDLKQFLQNPMKIGIPEKFINKMRRDISILLCVPIDGINIYSKKRDDNKVDLFIEVFNTLIEVPKNQTVLNY